MIVPRAVATLGIGYGALATATLGFIATQETPTARPLRQGGGGSGGGGRSRAIRRRRIDEDDLLVLGVLR